MKYCKTCLMNEKRPRIKFNDEGICGACEWSEKKKRQVIDWDFRKEQLIKLCKDARNRNNGRFDCIVPVSGGKDSSYVAYKMKHELGMNPLTITIAPPLPYEVGNNNLENFIKSGFDNIKVSCNYEIGKKLAKKFFIEQGQPLLGWILSVQTTIFRMAVMLDIPFVMFGEEGETEYGGSTELNNNPFYSVEESIRLYLSGNDPIKLLKDFKEEELYWWTFPTEEDLRKSELKIAHWSYFEPWDSYRNYVFTKKHFEFQEMENRCIGTYNNFGQLDTCLYDLHCYLMYLKFGFGRCTQDANIDIRRGALSRKQARNLVKIYDGEFPQVHLEKYIEYFDMTRDEFQSVLDKFANQELFAKENDKWMSKFTVE